MVLDKSNFEYVKGMINDNDSITTIKAFCKGFGLDVTSYSSPIHISDNKITITYRRNNYYVDFNHSKIYGTTYFNKIK